MAKKISMGATLSLKDGNFFTNMKSAASASNGLKGALTNATSTMKTHGSAATAVGGKLKSLIGVVGGVVAAYASFSAVKGFITDSIAAADAQVAAEKRLETTMQNVAGVTKDQIEGIKKYAAELQGITTIGDEVAITGASQLASYKLQSDAIKTLMPALNDLAVGQYGVSVTSEQMTSAANLVGKAMSGNVTALKKMIPSMSEAQQNILKTGTEAEKAAVVVDLLKNKYGGLAEAMANTPKGRIQQLKNAWGDMQEVVGAKLYPAITSMLTYITDKIPSIQAVFTSVMDAAQPVIGWFTNTAIPTVGGVIESLIGGARTVITACEPAVHRLGEAFGNVSSAISSAFGGGSGAIGSIINLASVVLPGLINAVALVVNGFSAAIPIVSALSPIIAGIAGGIAAYKAAVVACTIAEQAKNAVTIISAALQGTQTAATVTLTAANGAYTVSAGTAATATTALGTAITFLTGPVGIIVAAIGAAIAIGVALYKNWDKIKAIASKVWNGVKNAVGTAMTAARDTVKEKLNNIKTAYTEHGGGIKGAAAAAMEAVKGYYTAGYTFLNNLTGGRLGKVVDTVKQKLAPMVGVVKDRLSGIKDKFSEAFSGAIDFVKKSYNEGALKPIVDKVTNAFGTLKDKIGEKLAPVKEVMGKAFEGAKTIVAGKLNNIKTAYEEHGGGLKGAAAAAMTAVKEYYKTGYDAINALTGGRLGKVVDTIKQKLAPVISIISTAFNGVKSAVMPIITAVKDYVVNTFNNIRSTIGNIISVIKGNFETFANSIKNAFEGVKNGISTVIDGVKTIVMGAFQVIVGIFTLNIDTIKNGVQTIKDGFSTAFEGAKQIVLNVWNAIKSYAQLAFDNVRTVVTNAITGVKTQIENVQTTVSTAFNSVKTTVSSTFDSIKTKVTSVFETVKTTVKNAVDKIKGMFNFTWSLPKIKLPHFSISPAGWKIGDLLKGSIPKLNIEWYANGGIMTRPTLFGMNGNNAMVGGEAGPEAVLPLAQFWNNLERFIDRSTQNGGRPNITNNVYVTVEGGDMEDESLANTVAKRIIDVLENM